MTSSESVSRSLIRFPLGSCRQLVTIAFPLILSGLSTSLLGFFDRLFLSHYSLEAWNAASTSGYVAYGFQMMCTVIAMIAQSFIGQHLGAKCPSKVGAIVWQMIWFAFFSMLITYPASFLAENYFKGTEIEASALAYFRPLALFNFLFPLNAALTAFFVGRAQTRIIFFSNISIQLVNIALDYLLIFGFGGFIPPLGTFGAACATILSETVLCLILFTKFLSPQFTEIYQTHRRLLNLSLFKEILKVGIPRAIGRGLAISSWAFAAHLLVKIGGNHLLVLTLGTSLFMVFTFINDGIFNALTTVASHVLGAKDEEAIHRLSRSAFQAFGFALLLLTIPLIFMREYLISMFITEPLSPETFLLLKRTCIFIWFVCLANAFNLVEVSFITASRDTFFYACSTSANWITTCIPVYVLIDFFGCSPEYFFLIDAMNAIFFGVIYFLRFRKGFWKKHLLKLHEQATEA